MDKQDPYNQMLEKYYYRNKTKIILLKPNIKRTCYIHFFLKSNYN
jgi:hypothetical protein